MRRFVAALLMIMIIAALPFGTTAIAYSSATSTAVANKTKPSVALAALAFANTPFALPTTIYQSPNKPTSPALYSTVSTLNNAPNSSPFSLPNTRIGSCTTYYSSSPDGRKSNIRLAAAAIDKMLIMPGDNFYFNSVVGERTTQHGYQIANIILDGQLASGIGGGVCQVSSTLYYAWLTAGLDVVRAFNHSMPVAYLPLGLDATVSTAMDMVLVNTSTHPIYIKTRTNSDAVSVYIYGNVSRNTYRLKTSGKCQIDPIGVEYVVDNTLPLGTMLTLREARPGYTIDLYREVLVDEKVVDTHFIRTAKYPAIRQKVARPEVATPLA